MSKNFLIIVLLGEIQSDGRRSGNLGCFEWPRPTKRPYD